MCERESERGWSDEGSGRGRGVGCCGAGRGLNKNGGKRYREEVSWRRERWKPEIWENGSEKSARIT